GLGRVVRDARARAPTAPAANRETLSPPPTTLPPLPAPDGCTPPPYPRFSAEHQRREEEAEHESGLPGRLHIGVEFAGKTLPLLGGEEGGLERVARQAVHIGPAQPQRVLRGLKVLADVPAEIGGIVGVHRDAHPPVEQALQVV